MSRFLLAIFLILCVASCRPKVFNPKPTGYFRIDTPATHKYEVFVRPDFPYSFEFPAGSTVEDDTVFAKEKYGNKYWININVRSPSCVMNITYKEITPDQPLHKLMDDAWGLSYMHDKKADYIEPVGITNDYGVACILYTVGGNTASRYQFAATDSVKHFIRGALYFDVAPNADSLKPATDFMLQDIQHLLLTLKWK